MKINKKVNNKKELGGPAEDQYKIRNSWKKQNLSPSVKFFFSKNLWFIFGLIV